MDFPDRFVRSSVTLSKAFGLIPSSVFGCIWSLSENTTDGTSRVSNGYIAKVLGVNESTVSRAIQLLLGNTDKNKIPLLVDMTKKKGSRIRNYSPHYGNFEEFVITFTKKEKSLNLAPDKEEIDLKIADKDVVSSFIDDYFSKTE